MCKIVLLDSDGKRPPREPREGYKWVLEHIADGHHGHYGFSRWKEVPIDEAS